MYNFRQSRFALLLTLLAVLLAPLPIGTGAAPVSPSNANDPVLHWNAIVLQAGADDHGGTFGTPEQGGPTRNARALAIVHISIYDAVNAIVGDHEPYLAVTGLPAGTIGKASIDAAVAQAAHDTLVAMYPKQAAVFDSALAKVLKGIPVHHGRNEGKLVGAKAASNILADRAGDGGDTPDDPFFGPTLPKVIGLHQPDPLNPGQGRHVPLWGNVVPFAMDDVTNFHAPPPPRPDGDPLDQLAYAVAYNDVMQLGGDGVTTPTLRTSEQTEIGLFWGYEGSRPAAAIVQPDHPLHCPEGKEHCCGKRPLVRPAEYLPGRRRHRLLVYQIPIQLLAAPYRSPLWR